MRGNYIKNVRDFGALGDGSHDDTAALIQALADACSDETHPAAHSSGGSVFLPRGRYVLSETLILDNRVQLIGESENATIICAAPNFHGSTLIQLGTSSPSGRGIVNGTSVKNLLLHGSGSVPHGVYSEEINEFGGVQNCRIFGCTSHGIWIRRRLSGSVKHSPKNFSIANVNVRYTHEHDNDAIGINLQGHGHLWRMSDFTVTTGGNGRLRAGIVLDGNDASISHGHVEHCDIGVLVKRASSASIHWVIGHNSVNNLVYLGADSGLQSCLITHLRRHNARNLIRDDIHDNVITADNCAMYAFGALGGLVQI